MVLSGGNAHGFINPKFTPVHLVHESQLILAGNLRQGADAAPWQWDGIEVVKGQYAGPVALTLSAPQKEQAKGIRKLLADQVGSPAILFAVTDKPGRRAYLHAGGLWLDVAWDGKAGWAVESFDLKMAGVYAGGTDMLLRMARFILTDPKPDAPVSVGVRWIPERVEVGTVAGQIAGMEAFQGGDEGPTYLFVASAAGDRLFRASADAESFADATHAARLDSRSRRFAWADLGDGRPSLLSWDGKNIVVRTMANDGKLAPAGSFPFDQACLGLSPCSRFPQRASAVLISTRALPQLLYRETSVAWNAVPLPDGPAVAQAGPATASCAVADLDNDGFCDLLQPCRDGGVLWKGGTQGFQPPTGSLVRARGESSRCALGDFNQDGFLDLFISGPQQNELWENDGKGGFRPVIRMAGSLGYRAPAGASEVIATDLNHDSWPDLLLLYAQGAFMYHFSRGFRCFGEEGQLRLTGADGVADEARGQVACAVADFNGDSSLDLAVAFADGQVCCYYNDALNCPRLRLKPAPGLVGPVTATLWQGDRSPFCLGARPVGGAAGAVYVNLRDLRPCQAHWRQAGKPECLLKIDLPAKMPEKGLAVAVGE
jgi:hypothetical protein